MDRIHGTPRAGIRATPCMVLADTWWHGLAQLIEDVRPALPRCHRRTRIAPSKRPSGATGTEPSVGVPGCETTADSFFEVLPLAASRHRVRRQQADRMAGCMPRAPATAMPNPQAEPSTAPRGLLSCAGQQAG